MKVNKPIHCFLNSLSTALTDKGIDYRPLFIGVWDTPFTVTESEILYYDDQIRIDGLIRHFTGLFGGEFDYWFDPGASKEINASKLSQRLHYPNWMNFIIVDLFYFPYSVPYQRKHYPHIVIVDHQQDDQWYIRDPFFDWEGYIPDGTMLESFGCDGVYMGLSMNLDSIHESDAEKVSACFVGNFSYSTNKLITEVSCFIRKKIGGDAEHSADDLFNCMEQVGVLSKRLLGYELAIAYFQTGDSAEDDPRDTQVSLLVKAWESVLYSLARFAVAGKRMDPRTLDQKFARIEAMEYAIKEQLWLSYQGWGERNGVPV